MTACIICNVTLPEGGQLCPNCEKLLAPYKDILQGMLRRKPVEHKGIKYGCISAFIIRGRVSTRGRLKKPIVQVELMSARTNSVTIVDPKEVKIIEVFKK